MRAIFCVLISTIFLACKATSMTADAGSDAHQQMPDAAQPHDAGVDATVIVDAFVAPDAFVPADAGPCGVCRGDHACVRDLCVPTCGADLSGFEGALAGGLTVVGTYCRTPNAFTFAGTHVYELVVTPEDTTTTFRIERWTPGDTISSETVGSTTYEASVGEMVFASSYLEVTADEMHAIFGYTTTLDGYVGGVFDLATGSGDITTIVAPGNFDAVFADDTHLLIDGTGLGDSSAGQGVYLGTVGSTSGAVVVTGAGDASGSIALWADENLVLAGGLSFGTPWADGGTGDRVLVIDPAALSADTPIEASSLPQLLMPSTFELLSNGRVVSTRYNDDFSTAAVELRTLTHNDDGSVTVSDPTDLTTGGIFGGYSQGIAAGSGDDIILAFPGGLLIVR